MEFNVNFTWKVVSSALILLVNVSFLWIPYCLVARIPWFDYRFLGKDNLLFRLIVKASFIFLCFTSVKCHIFNKKKMFHFEISKAKRAETAGTSHSLFQFLSNCVENDWNPGNDAFRSPNTRSQLLRCWGTHLKRADNFHNFFTFSLIWIGLYVTWSADEPDRCGTLILFLEIIFFFLVSFICKKTERAAVASISRFRSDAAIARASVSLLRAASDAINHQTLSHLASCPPGQDRKGADYFLKTKF